MSEDDRRPCSAWLRRSGERPTLGSGFSNEENVLGVMFGSCTYRRRSKSCPVNKNWHCLAFFSYDLRACKALARLEIRCILAHAPGVFAFQTLYDIIIYDGLHGIGERAGGSESISRRRCRDSFEYRNPTPHGSLVDCIMK